MNACAGLAPEEMKGWVRFEDIRRGGYDPAARLVEMDSDGVDAEVLYPTPRLSPGDLRQPRRRAPPRAGAGPTTTGCRSTWRTRPSASAASRCCPTAASSTPSPRSSASSTGPGIRGVLIGCYPNGTLDAAARGRHGLGARSPSAGSRSASTWPQPGDAGGAPGRSCPATAASSTRPNRMIELIFTGVFDRFPELERRVRRGRLRLGAVLQGADRQQLPAARPGQRLRPRSCCRASTSSATSTSRSSPTRSASATATTSASSASCGRATTRTSAPTGPTRGARSRPSMSGVPARRARADPRRQRPPPLRLRPLGTGAPAGVVAELALGDLAAGRRGGARRARRGARGTTPSTRRARRGARRASSSVERRRRVGARRRRTRARRRPRRAWRRPRPRRPRGASTTSASTAGAEMFFPPRMMKSDVRPTTRR